MAVIRVVFGWQELFVLYPELLRLRFHGSNYPRISGILRRVVEMKNSGYFGNFNGNGACKSVCLSDTKRARHGRDKMPVLRRIWRGNRDLRRVVPHYDTLMSMIHLHSNFPIIRIGPLLLFSQHACNDVFMLMKDIHIRSQDYLNIDIRSGGFWQILCNRWTSVN